MLKQIIAKLFCLHKWEEKETCWCKFKGQPAGAIILYHCTVCGKMKKVRLG